MSPRLAGARVRTSTLGSSRGAGGGRTEGDVDVHHDVLIHPQHPEGLGEPADSIVLEVQGRVCPNLDRVAHEDGACRDRYVTANAVDLKRPLEIDLDRVSRVALGEDAGEIESDARVLVGLH